MTPALKPRERSAILDSLRAGVVPRWVGDVDHAVRGAGGGDAEVLHEIQARLKPLQELVSGHDFAAVLGQYLAGYQAHDEARTAAALRWLRAEYSTKTEARQ